MHTDLGTFTRTAAAMVARNDRRRWLRDLRRVLHRRAEVVGLLWCGLALAAVLLAFFVVPPVGVE